MLEVSSFSFDQKQLNNEGSLATDAGEGKVTTYMEGANCCQTWPVIHRWLSSAGSPTWRQELRLSQAHPSPSTVAHSVSPMFQSQVRLSP